MIVHVAIADAVENDHKVSHDLNFHPFFLAPFSPLSWGLVEQAYLDLKEFWLSYRTKDNPQHPSPLSLCKGPKSKFFPVFHALIVRDTTSFSAGYGIAIYWTKIFAHFLLIKMKYCCYWNHELKYSGTSI